MISVLASNSGVIWKKEPDPDVTHTYTKEVISVVCFRDSTGISLGAILTTPDKSKRGVVIQLDDAKVVNNFITVWWPDGDKYGKRHNMDEIRNGELIIEG